MRQLIWGLALLAPLSSAQEVSPDLAASLLDILNDEAAAYETQFCLTDQYGTECSIYFDTTEPVEWINRAVPGNKTPVFLKTPGMKWVLGCGIDIRDEPGECCLYGDVDDFDSLAICVQEGGISFFERNQNISVTTNGVSNE